MIVLGIEGTAHTIGVGIFDGKKRKILSDARRTYQPKRGIHPRAAARFIGENMGEVLSTSLSDAKLKIKDIGLISFSQGPGIGPCLRTIATGARALSLHNKIPLLGVNHCVAHIEIGKEMTKFFDPLVLYVSGGNTQILKLKEGRYRIFGETLDIGCGNMLDKFGREVGLIHPAGPKIETLANAAKEEDYIELPYVVKGTDLSFSGMLTSAITDFKKAKESEKEKKLIDLCFSLQETAFSMLAEVTERALCHLCAKEVILTGGVANNSCLQKMIKLVAEENDAKFGIPKGYCSDNGAMIAVLGEKMYLSGLRMKLSESVVKQKFRTDAVEIKW